MRSNIRGLGFILIQTFLSKSEGTLCTFRRNSLSWKWIMLVVSCLSRVIVALDLSSFGRIRLSSWIFSCFFMELMAQTCLWLVGNLREIKCFLMLPSTRVVFSVKLMLLTADALSTISVSMAYLLWKLRENLLLLNTNYVPVGVKLVLDSLTTLLPRFGRRWYLFCWDIVLDVVLLEFFFN